MTEVSKKSSSNQFVNQFALLFLRAYNIIKLPPNYTFLVLCSAFASLGISVLLINTDFYRASRCPCSGRTLRFCPRPSCFGFHYAYTQQSCPCHSHSPTEHVDCQRCQQRVPIFHEKQKNLNFAANLYTIFCNFADGLPATARGSHHNNKASPPPTATAPQPQQTQHINNKKK